MQFVSCTEERHAPAILAIFNHAILHSTALYDYQPRPPESMGPWFETKRRNSFPVIGAEASDGTLMGFASYGSFRAWPAYKYTVEHSVYIAEPYRGAGLGRQLMEELVASARANQVHTLVGAIDAQNAGSIALHEKLGFSHCGTVAQAAFKFGRWLDLALYQRILQTPLQPVDG